MEICVYTQHHHDEVASLWREAFPSDAAWNDPDTAIAAKVGFQPALFFVAVDGGTVIGTTMAGYDGHRGWLYTVAVKPDRRRQGVATALVRHAEQALAKLGCVKLNLQVRGRDDGARAFYESLGYVAEPRLSMGKPLGQFAGATRR